MAKCGRFLDAEDYRDHLPCTDCEGLPNDYDPKTFMSIGRLMSFDKRIRQNSRNKLNWHTLRPEESMELIREIYRLRGIVHSILNTAKRV